MSINVKNLNISNFKKLPLDIKDGEFASLICRDRKEIIRILKLLNGKIKSNEESLVFYNNQKALNKEWVKRNVSFINFNKLSNLFISPKHRLFLQLYFDPDFYMFAKTQHLESKYDYLNFKSSNGVELVYNLKKDIDIIINEFVESTTKIEMKWLDDFHNYISKFVSDNISKQSFSQELKDILKDYFTLLEKNNNLIIYERFLQSLWDQIFDMSDVEFSCNCLINYKKNKSNKKKENKWRINHLGFTHQKVSVEKNLLLIDNKIKYIRRNIWKVNKSLKLLKKLLAYQLKANREFASVKKLFKHIKTWVEIGKIQRNEFSDKQDKVVYETLQSEGSNVKGKIIEIIHNFHLIVLNRDNFASNMSNHTQEVKIMKKDVKLVTFKIWDWINEEFDKYEIKMNILNLNPSVLNYAYIKIINSIFLKKNNIILDNVLAKLNDKERIEFFNTLNIIISKNKNLSFLFLDSSYNAILKYDLPIYEYKNYEWNKDKPVNIFINNKECVLETFSGYNILKLTFSKGKLLYNNDKIELESKLINKNKQIVLNPFLLNKTKDTRGKIEVFISSHIKFTDEYMHNANTKSGDKICFYREEKYKSGDKVKIYYNENSIV